MCVKDWNGILHSKYFFLAQVELNNSRNSSLFKDRNQQNRGVVETTKMQFCIICRQ